jgi:hypothetical protein
MTQSAAILATVTDEAQHIIAALIGGARYGVKIRLPHALVMTLLFRRDLTSKQKIHSVLKLVMEHASNLAAFASIYKVRFPLLESDATPFLLPQLNLFLSRPC